MNKTRLVRKRIISEKQEIVQRDDLTYDGEPLTYDGEPVFYEEYPPISSQIQPDVVVEEDYLPKEKDGPASGKADLPSEQPTETKRNAAPAKGWGITTLFKNIIEKGWQIFTKSFWEAVLDRVWPKQ
jgi:hypothetical protein